MRRRKTLQRRLIALLFSPTLMAVSAAEAAQCGPRADIVVALKQRHGERPHSIAMTADGRVLELWVHEAGPWTLLMTAPHGVACIYATGQESWEHLPQGEPA